MNKTKEPIILAEVWQEPSRWLSESDTSSDVNALYLNLYDNERNYAFVQYQWKADNSIKVRSFLINTSTVDSYSVKSDSQEKVFSKISEEIKDKLTKNAELRFSSSPLKQQQLLINLGFDQLIKIKDNLPLVMQQALEEEIKQKEDLVKEEERIITLAASNLGLSVDKFIRKVAIEYALISLSEQEKKEQQPKGQENLEEKESLEQRAKSALLEMIEHNNKASAKEDKVFISGNSLRLWIRERKNIWMDQVNLAQLINQKAEEIHDHNREHNLSKMSNARSDYYQNILKKFL